MPQSPVALGFQLCQFSLLTDPDCIMITCCDQDYFVSVLKFKLIENSSTNCVSSKKIKCGFAAKKGSNVCRIIKNNTKENQIKSVSRRLI